MSIFDEVQHPGVRIRIEVFPAKISVTKASALMGVGRPALSNLLNGKASLSSDMATRIEKAFGFPRADLLEMQAQYDAFKAGQKSVPTNTKTYVPPFLSIKANDIEAWASHNIRARSRFAELLRTLVHSTGSGLTKVDFPGNDDAERPGWDGLTEASDGTPWVPANRSGWEFGTNVDPKAKAEKDFSKSVAALETSKRAEMTFVFVTPRRWTGKDAWVSEKKSEYAWKDVRVYDASDLEQWFEQSLSAQAWFANETGIPAQSVRSLDKCWADWADVATPPLPGSLFNTAIEEAKRKIVAHLAKSPDRPIIIAADSTDEALAFVAQCFSPNGGDTLESLRYSVLVFDKTGVLPRLAEGVRSFIPVVHTREVEVELAAFTKSMHSIVVYPRNSVNAEPDIILEPVGFETFEAALKSTGKNRDEITNLANESGRSLTILRRRLANVEAVRMPLWASEQYNSERLIPFMLVGAWHAQNETDKTGLSLLARDHSFDELENKCQSLIQLNDAPLWSIGTYRGVVSKIDLLYAIARYVTSEDLKRYFKVARKVLGEDDPALDLAEDQRWAASINGKTREFSPSFRKGISETLVLLAVHGGSLFKRRLGIDTEVEAALVVRDLLPTPLTTRVLEANDRDLPLYAEAAPQEFLSILERDLRTANPAIFGLLRPAGSGMFGSPSRTGLLWALEGLSWNPVTLPRAALILARLAQIKINDNWVNKPGHSLGAIFRAWMPQTAASHEERLSLVKTLFEKFPDVAWTLCVTQIGNHHQTGHYSHKPLWRPDGYGFGEPFPTWAPILRFKAEMVEIALSQGNFTVSMLCDLVDRLHDLSESEQDRVWVLIAKWAKSANDVDKVFLREKIRVSALSRRAALRSKKSGKPPRVTIAAKEIYKMLEPSDLLDKHAWLFRNTWIEESADELEDIENIDYEERNKRIQAQRIHALHEIHKERGIEGILDLAHRGNTSWIVGELSGEALLHEGELQKLVSMALKGKFTNDSVSHVLDGLIGGAFRAVADGNKREAFIRSIISELTPESVIRVLVLTPFNKATWSLVSSLGETVQEAYWKEVSPHWLNESSQETSKAVEMLMEARRPRAAFSLVRDDPKALPAPMLFRLLTEMAQNSNDKQGEHLLEHYYVEKAFKHIDSAHELTLEQKAGLEFAYIDALVRNWDRKADSGIPNLELYIEMHPEVLVQAIVWTYKRKDGAIDPPEYHVELERVGELAERGYRLLEAIKRIPGCNEHGEHDVKNLAKWMATLRKSCAELSRAEIADTVIGKLLSSAPVGKDGVWPCEAVRTVMEDIQSEDMISGVHSGIYNARGVHIRGNDGAQELQLAEKYRKWASQIRISSPFVASELLSKLADTYEDEANREITEAKISQRLR
jgi:addiction module HigA family antidote